MLIAERNLTVFNPFTPKPAILSILLCLTPDNFTCQWGTPRSHWVKEEQKKAIESLLTGKDVMVIMLALYIAYVQDA